MAVIEKCKMWLIGGIVAGLTAFLILLIVKLDNESRSQPSSVDWAVAFTPLMFMAACGLLWLMANYCAKSPISSGYVTVQGGHGVQYLNNLLSQLLVKNLDSKSIENLNEALMLRALLRALAYVLIIVYSLSVGIQSCSGCSVPYKMVSFGFVVAYLFRFILLFFNGRQDYARLKLTADEVRKYQESMDGRTLLTFSVPHLHTINSRPWLNFFDFFLWILTLAFAFMGFVWIQQNKCHESCAMAFHIYQFLVVAVLGTEIFSLVIKFILIYYSRISYIEGLDKLVDMIMEYRSRVDKEMQDVDADY